MRCSLNNRPIEPMNSAFGIAPPSETRDNYFQVYQGSRYCGSFWELEDAENYIRERCRE